MKDFLFPKPNESKAYSLLLLTLRIFFGLMLMTHGVEKMYNYTELCFVFPDPIGIGREISLLFAIFGELFCSFAFIFGALYRITMIPMLIVMAFAFFRIHEGNVGQGEPAFIYLIVLIVLYVAGPGKYSVDAKIYHYLHLKNGENYEY